MKLLLLLLALLLQQQSTNAILSSPRIPDILERIKLQKSKGGGDIDDLLSTQEDDSDVLTLYFDQTLDHFVSETTTTFKQRYFYTSRYVSSSSSSSDNTSNRKSIAFLCVGGEGPSLSTSVLVNSAHCTGDMIELASQLYSKYEYDVHLFALEHRYYGESFPKAVSAIDVLSTLWGEEKESEKVDYTYLSSRQAIQDIASFAQKMGKTLQSKNHNFNEVKWIAFGGSYPGMLSAWSHLLHPNIIFGAVSNSSPIQVELDFKQYHEHVGLDLENEEVGGSKLCRKIVEEGHDEAVSIVEKFTSFGGANDNTKKKKNMDSSEDGQGLEHLATLFNVCGGAETLSASRRNQEAFMGDGLIVVSGQSNDPTCTGEVCNIEKVRILIRMRDDTYVFSRQPLLTESV